MALMEVSSRAPRGFLATWVRKAWEGGRREGREEGREQGIIVHDKILD